MLVIAAVAAVFLNRTIYGRYLLALGRNETAVRYSGVKTIIEYANAQAYRAWRRGDDLMLDPEGKGHKGAVAR